MRRPNRGGVYLGELPLDFDVIRRRSLVITTPTQSALAPLTAARDTRRHRPRCARPQLDEGSGGWEWSQERLGVEDARA